LHATKVESSIQLVKIRSPKVFNHYI
jgi:hypothetical protein